MSPAAAVGTLLGFVGVLILFLGFVRSHAYNDGFRDGGGGVTVLPSAAAALKEYMP